MTSAESKVGGGTRLSSQRFEVPALSMHDGLYVSRLTSTGTDLVRGDILETEKMHASTRKLVLG